MQPVCLPLRGLVVFPGMFRVLSVGRPSSLTVLERHGEGAPLCLIAQRDPDVEDPMDAELAEIGVLAQVLRVTHLPDGTARVLVEGLERVRRTGPLTLAGGATTLPFAPVETRAKDGAKVGALARQLAAMHQEWLAGTGLPPSEHLAMAPGADDPDRLADHVSTNLDLSLTQQIGLLEELDVQARLEACLTELVTALAQQRIAAEVNDRVQAAMDESQREYHLKEQLKAIRAELGEAIGSEAEADTFEDRVKAAGMPPEVEVEALREVDRLRRVHTESAEYTIIRTWLETVCEIPWSKATADNASLRHAQAVLDRDHFGLDKVKERILEYLAVRQLQPTSTGPILCFVGPPGVGKTSLGRSIAAALGRAFGRIALGGIKDETEIRGHRRTYVGALPGRIVRALSRAETRNPVLVLDEIDKVGNDFRGDPASALLEVLDPAQNSAFVDHYLDVPVDLSQVLFIGTANLMDPIPAALLDRLEIIEIPGYTEEEKQQISRRFLLPKLAENHGLTPKQLQIDDEALQHVIRDYTREAGVRDLERQLAALHRKVARQVVEGGRARRVKIQGAALARYLGPPKYFAEVAEGSDAPGVVIGLAWTAAGGDILFVEAIRMPGKGPSLKLTGSLGDVMKESAEAAMSWLRAHHAQLQLEPTFFEAEFHLHVPAGAIPKDGPSAGVTMVTALASLATGRAVRPKLAMTGEITLRGKVLPVGGIKEKALAARRAGVVDLILPDKNRNDLEDIPEELRKDLRFHFVSTVDQVLALALTST
jgi:ATP-dependent Lon protease